MQGQRDFRGGYSEGMSRSLMNAARLAIGGALLALAIVLAAVIWIDRSTPVTITISESPERSWQVSIEGEVATPGVVIVAPGARLSDVAAAAGGFTENADFASLNLAGRVGDGETVRIPRKSNQLPDASAQPVTSSSTEPVVNLNTATVPELDRLPGIGEVLAGRIVDYRETNGAFQTVDELSNIEGISPRLVDRLRPLVTVGNDG